MPQDARDLKGKTGIRRLINATRYSRDGFAKAFRTEEAFRQESILSVVGLVALFFIPAAFTLKLFAVFALVFLLVTELLNSAVEAAIDRMGWPEINAYHAELQRGQDVREDAGGYFIRAIKALFGIKGPDEIVTYQEAARAEAIRMRDDIVSAIK